MLPFFIYVLMAIKNKIYRVRKYTAGCLVTSLCVDWGLRIDNKKDAKYKWTKSNEYEL